MQENQTDTREKSYRTMRMIYDVTMGVLMIGVGSAVLMAKQWNIAQLADWEDWMRYFFGGVLVLYGSFRIYRGIKQPG